MKLIRHSVYNLLGLGLPLLTAVFSIPVLIRELGDARFGLLTLIWAIVSYLSLFDLGLGRALTQHLAVMLEGKERRRVGALVVTAIAVIALFSIVAGALMAALGPWGLGFISAVPDQAEVLNAIWIMALAMPAVVLTAGFRGILEARHAFAVINLIRLPMGLLTFLGPLAVVLYGPPRLDVITMVLAGGRVVTCALHAWYAKRYLPDDVGPFKFDKSLIRPLCSSGGWMTISNIVSPVMSYADRFIVGAVISSAAVAYYVTPQELITKLSILPGALTAVLFPALAAQIARQDKAVMPLINKAVGWIFLTLLPITVAIAIFAKELLTLWVGESFASQSYVLLQIFSAGMFITCIAQIPFTVIQGAGKSHLTAIFHLIEVPLFLGALLLLSRNYGLTGAAFAWFLRVAVDAILMFWGVKLVLNRSMFTSARLRLLSVSALAVVGFVGAIVPSPSLRAAWLVAIVALVLLIAVRGSARFGRGSRA
ncbi:MULTISPECIES: flippase [Achromobacter]|uniref:flippase n=1 Tax=Achromobacter TaxID=222 RepID=UPI001CBAF0B0|nr:flippase [Achromobacter mucicolens]MDH1521462.1 flippase [Achromobacter mucicolens]UAN01329.1 flippase [Achromobacter mucicolens]